MLEVVEGHLVVVHVHLAEEFAQHVRVDVEFARQVEVDVHLLKEQQDLLVLPLPVVERWHPQTAPDLFRQCHGTEIEKGSTMSILYTTQCVHTFHGNVNLAPENFPNRYYCWKEKGFWFYPIYYLIRRYFSQTKRFSDSDFRRALCLFQYGRPMPEWRNVLVPARHKPVA